jgi:hypothetical protein
VRRATRQVKHSAAKGLNNNAREAGVGGMLLFYKEISYFFWIHFSAVQREHDKLQNMQC